MEKHAYCIMAHNEPEIFKRLVGLLDDPRNDIYVHIDKKSDIRQFQSARCKQSNLVFLTERIACKWGSLDIVRAELLLFKTAKRARPYQYYHLISGVDLPLQSQDVIHKATKESPSTNYIGICNNPDVNKVIEHRTRYYFPIIVRPGGHLIDRIKRIMALCLTTLQQRLHIHRSFPFPLWKGAQWISITDDFCSYLLDKEIEILSYFRCTLCPDEIAIHSVFMNSPFVNTQHKKDGDEYDQCLREIDWTRGAPYTWKSEDLEILINSRRWFARKFSSIDMEIVNNMINKLEL